MTYAGIAATIDEEKYKKMFGEKTPEQTAEYCV